MNDSSSSDLERLPPEQARLIDSLCDRFEAAWCGVRPRIADYLAGVDPVLHPVLSRELIQLDIFYRQKVGEKPSRKEYLPWLATDPPQRAPTYRSIRRKSQATSQRRSQMI